MFRKGVISFRTFISNHPLIQFLDQLNPLSDLTHKRRLTKLGPEGINLSNRTVNARDIHPSYFGSLCPVETPDGPHVRMVNSPTLTRHLKRDKRLQSLVTRNHTGWCRPLFRKSVLKQKTSYWISQKRGAWIGRFARGLLRNALGQIRLREFFGLQE